MGDLQRQQSSPFGKSMMSPAGFSQAALKAMDAMEATAAFHKSLKYARNTAKHAKHETSVKHFRVALSLLPQMGELSPELTLESVRINAEMANSLIEMAHWNDVEVLLLRVQMSFQELMNDPDVSPDHAPTLKEYHDVLGNLAFAQYSMANTMHIKAHKFRSLQSASRTYQMLLESLQGTSDKEIENKEKLIIGTLTNLGAINLSAQRYKDAKAFLLECKNAEQRLGLTTASTDKLLSRVASRHQASITTGAAIRIQMVIRRIRARRAVDVLKFRRQVILTLTMAAVSVATFGTAIIPIELMPRLTEVQQMLRELELKQFWKQMSQFSTLEEVAVKTVDELALLGIRTVDAQDILKFAANPDKFREDKLTEEASFSDPRQSASFSFGDLANSHKSMRAMKASGNGEKRKSLSGVIRGGKMKGALAMMVGNARKTSLGDGSTNSSPMTGARRKSSVTITSPRREGSGSVENGSRSVSPGAGAIPDLKQSCAELPTLPPPPPPGTLKTHDPYPTPGPSPAPTDKQKPVAPSPAPTDPNAPPPPKFDADSLVVKPANGATVTPRAGNGTTPRKPIDSDPVVPKPKDAVRGGNGATPPLPSSTSPTPRDKNNTSRSSSGLGDSSKHESLPGEEDEEYATAAEKYAALPRQRSMEEQKQLADQVRATLALANEESFSEY